MTLRRFAAAGVFALSLFMALLWLAAPPATGVRAADLCAGNYGSIQAAIDAAGNGDTVRVPVGAYTETLVITQGITIQGGWDAGCATRVGSDPAQTTIDGNQDGSVIRITAGSAVIEGLTITGGWAEQGGGIHIQGATPTLRRLIITGNTISTTTGAWTYGAGVYIASASVTIDHCDVLSNAAYADPNGISLGGGVYIDSSSPDVYFIATRIMFNGPAGDATLDGGGIATWDGPALHFLGSENVVAHNHGYRGGGIRTRGDITGATIISNTGDFGGGLFLDGTRDGVVANSLIVGNLATLAGSGIYVHGRGQVVNNTIVDNLGGLAGLAIGDGEAVVTSTNNIIAGHEVGIRNWSTTVSPTLVTNNLWDNELNYLGVVTGATDLHVNPVFVDEAGGDYHLADDSPLIDAGTLFTGVVADFEGDPRPIGVSHDIGFDEWGSFIYMPLVVRAP